MCQPTRRLVDTAAAPKGAAVLITPVALVTQLTGAEKKTESLSPRFENNLPGAK